MSGYLAMRAKKRGALSILWATSFTVKRRIGIPRAKLILAEKGVPEFESFDRFAQFEESEGKSLHELLTVFSKLREKNLETLRDFNLQPSDYNLEGKHPELGIVNLKQLLSTWSSMI